MRLAVGIDIGGTFTDVVGYDYDGRQVYLAKVPTTPADLAGGLLGGLQRLLELAGARPTEVERLIHGTTIATNAILEERGARIGILTTEGFEDTLVIGRQKRSQMYNLFIDPETPQFLAPRRRIKGVPERLDPEGNVLRPLDEAAVRRLVTELVEGHGVEALAVCYLFSFRNPAHEQRTRALVAELYPELPVSLSSLIDPKFREYERLVVTAFDAYVRPVMARYLDGLRARLHQLGADIHLEIMQSRGGITGAETVVERTVATILSGPAAGVIGARYVAGAAGEESIITADIGGTSCDVALVQGGKPLVSSEGKIGTYPLRQPMVDVNTIGAGGGSVAWLDAAGGLRVGPRSAGSNPGPACYGWGGREPTVTDASVVLGYLNPEFFAGGAMRLQPELAARAIEAFVAAPLGLTLPQAAAGIHRILNARMADQMRLVSIRRGHDPRRFTLVPLGGAGPVHAGRLAEGLSIGRIMVPATPGVLSAFGLLAADIEHEYARTYAAAAADVDLARMAAIFAELDAVCAERMRSDRVPAGAANVVWSAEMRYVGQSYELEVPFATRELTPATVQAMVEAFHRAHGAVYGHHNPANPVEFVNLRTVHSYRLPQPDVAGPPGTAAQPTSATGKPAGAAGGATEDTPAPHAQRRAYFDEHGDYVPTPIYRREALPAGAAIRGPAIVEQADTTTVVYPAWTARLDPQGNLWLERSAEAGG